MKILKSIFVLIIAITVLFMPLTVFAEYDNLNDVSKHYFNNFVNTGKDNGYSKEKKIKKKDPHYGWKLGEFYMSGYTAIKDEDTDNPIFLKNVGDDLILWFTMYQDIDCLNPDENGDSNLVISEDKNGYDLGFGTEKTNFGRGALIIKYTDYQNKEQNPIIYADYLKACKVNANTKVDVFEEGDYEVALDYEIKNNSRKVGPVSILPSYTNYRMYFNFSVRNGNCMVFPFDTETGEELTNSAITENGFYLDFAKSKYLDINIKKEVMNESKMGLVIDTRYNRPAKDGEEYTEEGIYTITAKNKYTAQETKKVIYVGRNDMLKAYVTTGLSLPEIQNMMDNGAVIEKDGTLTKSSITIADAVASEEEHQSDFEEDTANDDGNDDLVVNILEKGEESNDSSIIIFFVIVITIVVFVAGITILKRKQN